jgi:hypothetical protein
MSRGLMTSFERSRKEADTGGSTISLTPRGMRPDEKTKSLTDFSCKMRVTTSKVMFELNG